MNPPFIRAAAAAAALLVSTAAFADQMTLTEIPPEAVQQGWNTAKMNRSVTGKPLTVAGKIYESGIGSHSPGEIAIQLHGDATRFTAEVGLDDATLPDVGTARFLIYVDGKVAWESGPARTNQEAKPVDIDLTGAEMMILFIDAEGHNERFDHTNWLSPVITYDGQKPTAIIAQEEPREVLTPPPPAEPRINGARVYGVRPGSPVIFKVPVTGDRPMKYAAEILPDGLKLDNETGILTGSVEDAGTYEVTFTATNAKGEATQDWRLEVGEDKLALTPPMGWNSWNVYGLSITQEQVKDAADAFVESGLIDHGWTYVNIDDAWTIKPGSDDPKLQGRPRHEDGMIAVNEKFPDMKGLVDHIHGLGLKAGIYSSPGPLTCGLFVSSFGFEEEDAEQWAAWGFDYLKYDWCRYREIAPVVVDQWQIDKDDPLVLRPPYTRMSDALDRQDRDIVYSLCQYGRGDVWQWGNEVGGELWRTTGDIRDTWASMSGIGFGQAGLAEYAGPGSWNDPDMLVVGKVGWGPTLSDSRLTPNEQYTHISLWSMLAAPMLIGCDLTQLDDFTLGLLTNDEVIAVNQDPLGKQATRVQEEGQKEVWAKPLEDGSVAVALFNRGPVPAEITADFSACGVDGEVVVRDLWRQKNLGKSADSYTATIPRHGVLLVRLAKP